jgi:hypothetical protein
MGIFFVGSIVGDLLSLLSLLSLIRMIGGGGLGGDSINSSFCLIMVMRLDTICSSVSMVGGGG